MTVWTTGNSLGTARDEVSGCGSSAAGFVAGGVSYLTTSEERNALVWAAGGSMSTGRSAHVMFGTQSAALSTTGRRSGGRTSSTENYNGTSFSSGAAFAYDASYAAGCGTTTAGMVCGGTSNEVYSGAFTGTYTFNGTAWSSSGALVAARYLHAVAGSQSAAFECGGENSSGSIVATCNNFNGSTWASSGALPNRVMCACHRYGKCS